MRRDLVRTRWPTVALVVGLVVAACGSTAPSPSPASPGPTGTAASTSPQPTGTAQPTGTPGSTPSQPPLPSGETPPPVETPPPGATTTDPLGYITGDDISPPERPLPEPLLTTAEQITDAMAADDMADQAVVSMLAMLGIGTYREDGTVIHKGAEQQDGDLYLTEPEVRGLIDMLEQGQAGENWMNVRDFADAMTDYGYTGTAEQLVQDYTDAYDLYPDAPMSRFVHAQAFLEVDAQIQPLGVWLLFVDGFVGPNPSAATASIASTDGIPITAALPSGLGVSFRYINGRRTPAQAKVAAQEAQLIANAATLTLEQTSSKVHEVHQGETEQPVLFDAYPHKLGQSPFSQLPALECTGGIANIPITFTYDRVLNEHGGTTVASGGSSSTDAAGKAQLKFRPQRESANGHGYVIRKVVQVTASIAKLDLIRNLCGSATSKGMTKLIGGQVTSKPVQLSVEWHERKVLHIKFTDTYAGFMPDDLTGEARSQGTDTIDTVLVQADDGSWSGAAFATAKGGASGTYAGQQGCPTSWRATQVMDAWGRNMAGRLPGDPLGVFNGNLLFQFLPATRPRAAFGTGLCAAILRPGVPFKYLPFNDARVWNTDLGLAVTIPPPPDPWQPSQGTVYYKEKEQAGTASISDWWTVTYEYPNPDPPPP